MYTDFDSFELELGEDNVIVRLSSGFENQQWGWKTERHCNAEYELHIILEGTCRLEIGDRCYTFTEGSGVVIPPEVFHHPAVTSGTFERFSVSFTVSEGPLQAALDAMIPNCSPFPIAAGLVGLCRTVYAEYKSDSIYKSAMLQAYLSVLMLSVFRAVKPKINEQRVLRFRQETSRAEKMDAFFNGDLTESCREETLAELLHVSKRQLARILHRYYGIGFRQKLLNTRMDRAAWLLRTSDKKIGEIAWLVGYVSEGAFFQAFKNHFQITPLQYRKQNQ